jgi:hypothetical protein
MRERKGKSAKLKEKRQATGKGKKTASKIENKKQDTETAGE